eukprot:GFYU01003512.1.p1 GENE.GFYU01003512.1~~GFYU01003512.1.p1  ORF type:complete len:988 (+),score=307.90 GFYU01003512.1:88-3051(+)
MGNKNSTATASSADSQQLRVGVDVGGTNTDAVIMRGHTLCSSKKHPTTSDVTTGIVGSIEGAIEEFVKSQRESNPAFEFNTADVGAVMIGTTHFVNALVQRKNLAKVAVIRLCSEATRNLGPFSDFPEDLRELLCGHTEFMSGGQQFDGTPLGDMPTQDEVARVCRRIAKKGIKHIVISAVFSPVDPQHENAMEEMIRKALPDVDILKSSEIGGIGLLERENAAIVNSALRPLAQLTIRGFIKALKDLGFGCPLFLTQNDGTLMASSSAIRFPVLTFASGPTNSMRGAAWLSGQRDCIIVDIGGTTADVGALVGGFPRLTSTTSVVAGVRTAFRMPDVLSVGLGGGSLVTATPSLETPEAVEVGPVSVGYELTSKSLVFGGDVLTASDVAVAAGITSMGDPSRVSHLSASLKAKACARMEEMLSDSVDKMKLSSEDVPVLLVGGGSALVPHDIVLPGASEVTKPANFSVANAVGAAISQIASTVDKIVSLAAVTREEALDQVKAEAIAGAVAAGAEEATVNIVEVTEVPLAYVPGNATRITVKAAGDLNLSAIASQGNTEATDSDDWEALDAPAENTKTETAAAVPATHDFQASVPEHVRVADSYVPTIEKKTKHWIVSPVDIEYIAIGAGILGTGGGGDPYIGRVRALEMLRQGKVIRVMSPDMLTAKDAVVHVAMMGAPGVMTEKLPSGEESMISVNAMQKTLPGGKKVTAIGCAEVGGVNSMEPMIVSAKTGLPVVDADGMGRAFPELQMFAPHIYGHPCTPAALCDEKSNEVVITNVSHFKKLEDLMRVAVVNMGCMGALTLSPMSGTEMQEMTVKYTLSQAWYIGRAVSRAQLHKVDPVKAVLEQENGKMLFVGKISDLARNTEGGFTRGTITLDGLQEYNGKSATIDFQNENLITRVGGDVVASVPDLICIVDSDTGAPVTTENLRYGLRVTAFALQCSPVLTSDTALKVVGPKAFGYADVVYRPISEYVAPQSLCTNPVK